MSKQKLIYILSAGRSGSTLLDVMLGNGENCISTGETVRFPELNAEAHGFEAGTPCYDFWKKIEKEVGADMGTPLDHPRIHAISKQLEFHTAGIKQFFGAPSKEDKQLFDTFLKSFHKVVFNNYAGKSIIDSSKYAFRLIQLVKNLDHEICVIYLLRDPVSVVNSFAKKDVEQPPKGFFAANAYYMVIHYLCRLAYKFARRNGAKTMVLTYDEMANKPVDALKEIASKFELNMDPAIKKIEANEALSIGLLFEGNRIRLKKEIKLKKPDWKPSIGYKDSITWMLNSWLYNWNRGLK